MRMLRRATIAPCAVAMLLSFANGANAIDAIGQTVALTPAASGTASGRLAAGSDVFQGETITTGPSGVAELQFLDSTHLALGPSSAVALDEFVYSGNGQANAVAVGLTKGLFRFATGSSAKKSYRVETPLASIGVRGTGLLIDSRPAYTAVTLEHGEAIVCLRENQKSCRTLKDPGDTVIVSSDGHIGPSGQQVANNFFCSRSTQGSRLCTPYGTDKADNPNPADGGGGVGRPGGRPTGGGSRSTPSQNSTPR